MKGRTDKWKLFAAAAMCILIAAVSVTGGLLLEKRQRNVPAVEIIEVGTTASSSNISQTGERSETAEKLEESSIESGSSGVLVNINTAAASELEGLKGIGEKTAQAIIEYREQTPFEKIEDIKNVKGIGDKKFEDIKDSICV